MQVKIKRLDPRARIPEYKTGGSAAVDLCSMDTYTLQPYERRLFQCGVAVEIPSGSVGYICSRSGLALHNGVQVLNAPGVIDSDYRGELGVLLVNLGKWPVSVNFGDRIAQLVIQPVSQAQFMEVEELSDTVRGGGGFGSTGVGSAGIDGRIADHGRPRSPAPQVAWPFRGFGFVSNDLKLTPKTPDEVINGVHNHDVGVDFESCWCDKVHPCDGCTPKG